MQVALSLVETLGYMLANCCFATVFIASRLAGLRHLGCSAGERQRYGSPKNGQSEANQVAVAVSQSWAILWQNCRAQR
jgi:hypothetical protein